MCVRQWPRRPMVGEEALRQTQAARMAGCGGGEGREDTASSSDRAARVTHLCVAGISRFLTGGSTVHVQQLYGATACATEYSLYNQKIRRNNVHNMRSLQTYYDIHTYVIYQCFPTLFLLRYTMYVIQLYNVHT